MTQSSENTIKQLEERIKAVNNAKIRTETQLEELRKQRDSLLAQLAELNVNPSTLDDHITQLEQEIKTALENIEQQIPEGF